MTTENNLNEEIVDQNPMENNENNSDALDSTIEERVEEITREEQLSQDLASERDKFLRLFAEFENYKRRTTKNVSSCLKQPIKKCYRRCFLFWMILTEH